jgi:hypothetical protein
MEATHTVQYEGLKFEVIGDYEAPEEETGYKGGFSYSTIQVNDVDVSWMLNDQTIERINEIVIEENY